MRAAIIAMAFMLALPSAARAQSVQVVKSGAGGNAATATALAANGANCSAGNYPLGVDASGAVESCTAVTSGMTLGSTTVTGFGTATIARNNAGVLGEYTITGTGTVVAMAAGPTFTAPALGAATGTSLALGGTLTAGYLQDWSSAGDTTTLARTSSANFSAYHLVYADNGLNGYVVMAQGGSNLGGTFFGASGSNAARLLAAGSSLSRFMFGTYTSQPLIIGTNNTARLTFGATGLATFATLPVFTSTAPAVSNTTANSCGTTAATLAGSDTTGIITVGATAGTSCTVTFTIAAPNRRQCWANNETTANLLRYVYLTTTTGKFDGTMIAGDVLSYGCLVY